MKGSRESGYGSHQEWGKLRKSRSTPTISVISKKMIVYFYFVYFTCMYVYHMFVRCPQSPEEGGRSMELELQVVVSLHVGTELNLGALQEQELLLSAEPSL